MIQTIGFMIGFYIITRMTSLASRTGDRAESVLVKVFAVISILVAAWGMVSLLTSGASLPDFD